MGPSGDGASGGAAVSLRDLRSAHTTNPAKPEKALCGMRMPPVAVPGSPPCLACARAEAKRHRLKAEPRRRIVDFVVERPARTNWPANTPWPKLTTRKARPGKGYSTVGQARQAV